MKGDSAYYTLVSPESPYKFSNSQSGALHPLMQMTLRAPSPLTLRVRDFNHLAFFLTLLEAARRMGPEERGQWCNHRHQEAGRPSEQRRGGSSWRGVPSDTGGRDYKERGFGVRKAWLKLQLQVSAAVTLSRIVKPLWNGPGAKVR